MIKRYIEDYEEVTGKVNYYACPICLKEFLVASDRLPMGLTREHVPPQSLGGFVKCYTCAECNNTFGAKADNSLFKGIQLNAKTFFSSLRDQKVRVVSDNAEIFQGQVSTNDDGTLTMCHSKKNNHANRLERFIGTVNKGRELSFIPIVPNVDLHLFNVGLLKSAYLFAFEKFGYNIVQSQSYDIVREQLMNPDDKIYFENTILHNAFSADQEGVYIAQIDGLEFVCAVLKVKYGNSEVVFGVKLPSLDPTSSLLSVMSYSSAFLNFSSDFSRNSIHLVDGITAKQFASRLTCIFRRI